VREAADDGVDVAQRLFAQINKDRTAVAGHDAATVSAIRLFELLPKHPILTLGHVIDLLQTTKPTAAKAIAALEQVRVLRETTKKKRDRVYAYHHYIQLLTGESA
jgi:hypothetical protein